MDGSGNQIGSEEGFGRVIVPNVTELFTFVTTLPGGTVSVRFATPRHLVICFLTSSQNTDPFSRYAPASVQHKAASAKALEAREQPLSGHILGHLPVHLQEKGVNAGAHGFCS